MLGMEMSTWLPELEIGDPDFLNQYDQMSKPHGTVYNFNADSFPSESYPEKASTINKTSQMPEHFSANTSIVSFGDLKHKDKINIPCDDLLGYEVSAGKKVPNMARNQIQAQDHVIAERKRREKLNQHFISLSSLLPNLKRMDKASVLEDASNYIKQLQDRIKELEEGSMVIKSVEYSSFCKTNNKESDGLRKSSPVIEVRMSGSSMLLKIQCQKKASSLAKVLSILQKHGLSVISSSSMPFANTILLITIVAQIEDDFCTSVITDVVKNLELAI